MIDPLEFNVGGGATDALHPGHADQPCGYRATRIGVALPLRPACRNHARCHSDRHAGCVILTVVLRE